MIRPRTAALLLAAVALLLLWYSVGGRQEIQWHLAVRRAAQGPWDLSVADRYPNYGPLYKISFTGGIVLLATGMVNVVLDLSRSIRKAMNDRASKAS